MKVIASKAHAPFVALVKQRFKYCSPFRLGIAVGESGANLKNPYTPQSRAAKCYAQGVESGKCGTHSIASPQPIARELTP